MRAAVVVLFGVLVAALSAAPALAADVVLTADGFEPEVIEVTGGETIMWTNASPDPVTIAASDGSWDSGELAPGATFSIALTEPGEITYTTAGGAFNATIVVLAAAGAQPSPGATASPAPPPPSPSPTESAVPLDPQQPAEPAMETLPRTGTPALTAALLAGVLLLTGTVLVRNTKPLRREATLRPPE